MKKPVVFGILSIFFFALALGIFLVKNSDCASGGIAGQDIKATRCVLVKISDILVEADKKGDVSAIESLLDTLTPLMQKIDASTKSNPAMRACHLASAHLADGTLAVYKGDRWRNGDRFKAALADCQ